MFVSAIGHNHIQDCRPSVPNDVFKCTFVDNRHSELIGFDGMKLNVRTMPTIDDGMTDDFVVGNIYKLIFESKMIPTYVGDDLVYYTVYPEEDKDRAYTID